MADYASREATRTEAGRPRHKGTTIEGAPIGSLLLQVLRAHKLLGTELLAAVGVTPPHEIILLFLEEHGPRRQTDLVHYMARDRSTVTATLQAMERAGLIVRTPSPADNRQMEVALTATGRRLAPQARAAWQQLEAITVGGLSERRQRDLVRVLENVRDQLHQVLDAHGGPEET